MKLPFSPLDAAGIDDPLLRTSYALCRRLHLRTYEGLQCLAGSHFLPLRKQPALWALYGCPRFGDDLLDSEHPQRRERFELWSHRLLHDVEQGYSTDPVNAAFVDMVHTYRMDPSLVHDVVRAWRMDLAPASPFTYADFCAYFNGIAVAAFRMLTAILMAGADASARENAEARRRLDAMARGMYLAATLRDLSVDLDMGRLYLPSEELDRFGVTREEIFRRQHGPRVRDLIRFQVQRARSLLNYGAPAAELIDPDSRVYFDAARAGGHVTLRSVEKRRYDVLTSKPPLPVVRTAAVVLGACANTALTRWRHLRSRTLDDPPPYAPGSLPSLGRTPPR